MDGELLYLYDKIAICWGEEDPKRRIKKDIIVS